MSKDKLTPKQFADEFGVTQRTVYNWLAEGRINHFRIGGTIRIPAEEIDKSMRRKTETYETRAI